MNVINNVCIAALHSNAIAAFVTNAGALAAYLELWAIMTLFGSYFNNKTDHREMLNTSGDDAIPR